MSLCALETRQKKSEWRHNNCHLSSVGGVYVHRLKGTEFLPGSLPTGAVPYRQLSPFARKAFLHR